MANRYVQLAYNNRAWVDAYVQANEEAIGFPAMTAPHFLYCQKSEERIFCARHVVRL